jgi:GNAT-family acetyltransferase (TIGR03103 family)
MTSAIAMSRCSNKRITQRMLRNAGLKVPDNMIAAGHEHNGDFLARHGTIVVKPVTGEQGMGVSVGITTRDEMRSAIVLAERFGSEVMLEQYVTGEELRIIVIDGQVVAAAMRKPAQITGNGIDKVESLIAKQSRRRAAATAGESRIPVDNETRRCLAKNGVDMESVPENGRVIQVRETANLHTGGTLHDVTDQLDPELARAATLAARTLNIPVVGLDFMVAAHDQHEYCIIEANERPGLANHEPQPTAERFIDYLFPQTAA